jgi:hypothetical protein
MFSDVLGRIDFVFRQHLAGFGKCGWVGHGGSRGNHRRIVAWHIGYGQGEQWRRMTSGGEAAAFDRREMFAHAIYLGNIGARAQQRIGDMLLVIECKPRRGQGEQGRAAARNQAQRQIIGTQFLRHFQYACRGGAACRVRHRVRRFDNFDLAGFHSVAVARYHQPIKIALPMILDGARHGAAGLAGANHASAALGR